MPFHIIYMVCGTVHLSQFSRKMRTDRQTRRHANYICTGVYPAAGLRQFCVEIAPPYDRRNIDAALLREHSVRRICAHYKVCKFCVISSFASTHASNLRKKKPAKKIGVCAKKSIKKQEKKLYLGRIRTRDLMTPKLPPYPLCHLHSINASGKIWPLYTKSAQNWRMRTNCTKLAYAHKLRTIGVCAQIAQI